MARDTDPNLQKQVIYSVYVRNHTTEGTFRALIADLDRIRALGTDILWLMPIHPIGTLQRKGTLGSPYAIRDYRAVNPEYGTLKDFRVLADEIRKRGMKCMIDVVYNHTSPDSVLWQEHPEYFYKRPDGTPGNHVGDWTDIIDLDYNVPDLWDYQVETLKQWAQIVDGFRCDVASFVPVEFWLRARREIAESKPDFIWLAESVHRMFSVICRRRGMYSARDVDAYEAFDIEYEYDVREAFDRYLDGTGTLAHWTDLLGFQDFVYPANYNKLRYLENHDTQRIAARVKDGLSLKNYTAMLYFLKGTTLVYAGQERAATHTPSLFDADKVQWGAGTDLTPLMQTLYKLKQQTLSPDDLFSAEADEADHIAVMTRDDGRTRKIGVFSLRGLPGEVSVDLPDGAYSDLLSGAKAEVRGGKLSCSGEPIWICTA